MNYLHSIAGGGVAGDVNHSSNNADVLYTKVQKVYIKPQYKEERQRDLRVNVEIDAGFSPVCRKSLCVLLADDDDPCFLYSLFITEDDFKVLKAQQGLLVDFDNFATQLICLLEQCQAPVSGLSKTPKFLTLLSEEGGEWTFKFVETNNFKHLCHLSLNIAPANDTHIKTHMANKIKQLKENLLQKDRDIVVLNTRQSDLIGKLESKTKELDHLEQKWIAEKTELQMYLTQQKNLEKERLSQLKMELQHQCEKDRMELEQRHSEVIKQLHTELAEYKTQNITYRDRQSYLEATNSEQVKQIQTLEKELNLVQRDLSSVKKQNSKLDVDYHDRDKTVNSLKTKVAVLDQEMKDKTILINKHIEMLKNAKEQKQRLEELLAEKDSQLQRKQNSLTRLSDELVKANEILGKIQNELASTKSKLKLRTSIALEQERLLDAKHKEVGQLENKVDTYTKETRDARVEIDNLKEQVKNLQTQIEEKEKTIRNNENIIDWLNKKVTDSQSPTQSATIPASIQLTLPRTNKFNPGRFEHRTSASSTTQANPSLSGLSLRNPIVPSSNINHIIRSSARSTGVGISETTPGINFGKNGQISNTSTPLDRLNGVSKSSNSGGVSIVPPIIENNNAPMMNGKAKNTMNLQGGLRRSVLDKPLLPSSYFPKTLH